jgi:hypothetical protein
VADVSVPSMKLKIEEFRLKIDCGVVTNQKGADASQEIFNAI